MAVFKYKAKSGQDIKEGVLIASSQKEAAGQLRTDGLEPLLVQETSSQKKSGGFFSRQVSALDKANLCRYLSTMINSGLPLTEAVEVISEGNENPLMQKILNDVRASLQGGQPLSAAFSKYPDTFDEVFLTLVKAGEESSTLGKSFEYLGKQLYSDHDLNQRIKSTLAYPTVIIFASMGLGVAMLVFVIPKMAPVLLRMSSDFPLPVYTLFILKAGLFFSSNLLASGLAILLLAVISFLIFRQPKIKRAMGDFLSRIPFFGELFVKLTLGRFTRTLATLLKSGVPITNSLRVASKTLTLPQFKNAAPTFIEGVEKGVSLSEVLKKTAVFPSIMIRMIATGERTGSLDKMLLDLANFYEEEVSNSLKTLTSIIEPVIMLGIGVAVAVIVISVIAPIYSFVGSLSTSMSAH